MSQITGSSSINLESLVDMPPLPPKETPPPLPSSSSMPNMATQPPPSMYAGYYQQYMQYMQYMQYAQGFAAAGAQMNQQPAFNVAAAPPAPSHYATSSNNTVVSRGDYQRGEVKANESQQAAKPAIKFNLKFNNQQQQQQAPSELPTRKSRFNNCANIANEQAEYLKKQSEPTVPTQGGKSPENVIETPKSEAATAKAASDIVFDIHKWPPALKNYCTKVYQHFQKVLNISEDQVTKYLQQRITETFKEKPDLNIAWYDEPVPEIEQIRQVAPLSQQQIMQQKKQEAAIAAAKANASRILANKLQMKQKQDETYLKRSVSKTPKKRKNRSTSRSSSTSSSSTSSSSSYSDKKMSSKRKSDDYISLTDSSNRKGDKKSLLKKKTLKNIQINNLNGKKSFSFVQSNQMSGKKLTHKLKRNLSFQNENNNSEDSDDQSDEEFMASRNKKLNDRQQRFMKSNKLAERLCYIDDMSSGSKKNVRTAISFNKDEMDYTHEVCIGQCQDLEKEYFRLTGPPEAHMVRPESVLKKSLDFVLNKYNETRNYRYICEQLKSIRQDLSVQYIENEFTVEVYEKHARIAIKTKDREEFNQCQSKLKSLYEMVEKKYKTGNENNEYRGELLEHKAEFIGYRLLYSILTKSHTDLIQVIKEIKFKYAGHAYLAHLLDLRSALHLNNYVKFFRLYAKSNEMSKCLIDLFIERERKLALKSIIKSYRPSIKLESLREMLAYESLEKCRDDLKKYNLIIQSVPVSTLADSTSNGSLSSLTTTSTPNTPSSKYLNKNSSLPQNPQTNKLKACFEEVLDCKSCTLQGL